MTPLRGLALTFLVGSIVVLDPATFLGTSLLVGAAMLWEVGEPARHRKIEREVLGPVGKERDAMH